MIDTHAHYDDTAFEADLSEVFARAAEAGVTRIVNAASDAASLARIAALLPRHREFDS